MLNNSVFTIQSIVVSIVWASMAVSGGTILYSTRHVLKSNLLKARNWVAQLRSV